MGRLSIIAVLCLAPLLAHAYETDQFSHRLQPLEDCTELLDGRVNLSIEKAIGDWRGPRNPRKVVDAVYRDIGGPHWVDRIERWAMRSEHVDRLTLDRYDSIYHGHPLWATRVAGLFGVGPTIKVNGVLIGSDKLGHFISQGRKFWRRYQRSGDEAQAAEHSAYTERALFGQMTTGVYSNADLVANYEGHRFFRSLFEDDVVPGKAAILEWRGDHWIMQRLFTWADHVNIYWDEALNINHFDGLLYPHMKERLLGFCPDFHASPDSYQVIGEEQLVERYSHLQLRDTAGLRLGNLCPEPDRGGATAPVTGAAGRPH